MHSFFAVYYSYSRTDIKWDEMNILQTLHPPDKDYGLMKIEEPKTPYSYSVDDEHDESGGASTQLDTESLAQRVKDSRVRRLSIEEVAEEDEEDDEELTEEEKKQRREFEMKRKSHYNEFQAVKLARQLLEEDDEEDEEEDAPKSDEPTHNGTEYNNEAACNETIGEPSSSQL